MIKLPLFVAMCAISSATFAANFTIKATKSFVANAVPADAENMAPVIYATAPYQGLFSATVPRA